jgi:hypothetical protein
LGIDLLTHIKASPEQICWVILNIAFFSANDDDDLIIMKHFWDQLTPQHHHFLINDNRISEKSFIYLLNNTEAPLEVGFYNMLSKFEDRKELLAKRTLTSEQMAMISILTTNVESRDVDVPK